MAETNLFTVAELARHVDGHVIGDGSIHVNQLADLDAAGPGAVAYVDGEKFFETALASDASCLIVSKEFVSFSADAVANREFDPVLVEVGQPKLAFAVAAQLLAPPKYREPSIHPTALVAEGVDIDLTVYVGPHATIGEGVRIGGGTRIEAGVVIGDHVVIGRDCVLHPGVVIYDNVTVGDRVILHAGVCLGADGFGYVRNDMGYHKFPQIGTVVIEDDVELGAQTCVDRAALGQTRIGCGTKIDNMVHVGHNCNIGERVIIAAQTGISGSVTIEDDVVIGGQVGFGDHILVKSGAVIGSKAGILPGKIVRPGMWWGIPIQPLDEYKRMNAHLGRLEHMREEIKELRKQLNELKSK
jgi:UDP-3-O-[3-hydroxymyristoyl] glucosamine N-acyltransferase